MASNNRPPLEMDEITSNLKQSSGKGMDAFFPDTPKPAQNSQPKIKVASPTPVKPQPKKEEQKQESEANDIVISRYQDITIETIRKSVKVIGKETTPLRMTPEEKEQLSDIVYSFKKKGIRTSENEINRIGANFIMQDYLENKEDSILVKVIEALNS